MEDFRVHNKKFKKQGLLPALRLLLHVVRSSFGLFELEKYKNIIYTIFKCLILEVKMIRVKEGIDLLAMLRACGYSTYELRRQKIFGEATIQKLRKGGMPSWRELDFICSVTAYDVGELIEHVSETEH